MDDDVDIDIDPDLTVWLIKQGVKFVAKKAYQAYCESTEPIVVPVESILALLKDARKTAQTKEERASYDKLIKEIQRQM